MSHSSKFGSTSFIHNGSDWKDEGKVAIIDEFGKKLEIQGNDLITFVVDLFKNRKISDIESMTDEEFMKTLKL